MEISLPVSCFACQWQSKANPLPRCVKWYPAARRGRFARPGQNDAAVADGPIGPGSHQREPQRWCGAGAVGDTIDEVAWATQETLAAAEGAQKAKWDIRPYC
jgi:hypothetical protein